MLHNSLLFLVSLLSMLVAVSPPAHGASDGWTTFPQADIIAMTYDEGTSCITCVVTDPASYYFGCGDAVASTCDLIVEVQIDECIRREYHLSRECAAGFLAYTVWTAGEGGNEQGLCWRDSTITQVVEFDDCAPGAQAAARYVPGRVDVLTPALERAEQLQSLPPALAGLVGVSAFCGGPHAR